MKNVVKLLLFASVAAFISCEAPDATENDNKAGEQDSNAYVISTPMYPECWINEHTLQREVVHTPPWASKIDSSWQDSYGYRDFFRNAGPQMPKLINVSFWALFPKTEIDAKLVVGIDSMETQTFWVGIELKDSIKTANEWQKFNISLGTPAKTGPDHRLTVYVWGFDKQRMYVDDFAVSYTY